MAAQAIARALAGQGGFRIRVQGGEVAPPGVRLSEPVAGRIALWPMENSAGAIWQLFDALAAGVVPLLLPAGQGAARLDALRARFPGFGMATPAGIVWPAQAVRAADGVFLG